jgi:creatinine amidohydrolase
LTLRSNLWADLTRSEIAAARDAGALVVVPIGSTEQHASHLPVGTDSLTAGQMSLRAARAVAHPVLVAPTVTAAFSPHHASFPGTITLKLATLSALLEDITASIERAGFKRQLIVNGHGGNRGPLIAISTEFITNGREVGYVDYWSPPAAEIASILTGERRVVGHACEMETAMIMSLEQDRPARLDFYRRQVENLEPRMQPPYWRSPGPNPIVDAAAWWPPVYLGDDPGYQGDPRRATVETGDALIAAITDRLGAFFTSFATADLKAGIVPPAGREASEPPRAAVR